MSKVSSRWKSGSATCLVIVGICMSAAVADAQSAASSAAVSDSPQAMQERITKLEAEVQALTATVRQLESSSKDAPVSNSAAVPVASVSQAAPQTQQALTTSDRKTLDFLRDTTIDVSLDTYYAYNFNHPVGRVNLLRAYDVLSNEFSLNQASVIFDRPPDIAAGRRWGGRLDLQFGQATDTLQGNPANEPRPQIYRNIFQVYGTYLIPVGKGLNVDFGKWGSSIGIEGNYTKDQINYSRAYWFDFLPFYHMGLRASLPINDRFSVNYWVVNGTNQVESTNGFKDQLFGFIAKPRKSVTWTMNYYLGQEHPDRLPVNSTGAIPVQPGLNFVAIRPAPDGRTHIFDTYVTWDASSKLTFALEGDYFIQRLWQNAGPGRSSAPAHVDGGAAYVKYQITPKVAIATRAEYMSDRGGLFSGLTQALKENTFTLDYKLADSFLMRYEFRRDYSNVPTFLTDVQGVLAKDQNTATVGLIWWWGRKEGSW
jgi:Putative beta-barrel porin-2, OmpL-like. bbp2